MGARIDVAGADAYVLQEAISAYSDEAYTNAKKLVSTGLVGENPNINTDTETYIGQIRWFTPINPVINVASLTDNTDGTVSTHGSDFINYVKTVRTHGASNVNLSVVVTKQDGLAKFGRDFAETRAQDEHNSILSVMKGVAISEALNGCAAASGATGLGGQTFENDPADKKYGFYVDLGAAKAVVDATTTVQGAARAEGFLQAFGMAYKDYEPDYAYLVTTPEVMASLRSANLVDQIIVTDGNVEFSTIYQGKFRLVQSRATQSFTTAELTKLNTGAGVDIVGTKTTFLVLPGSVAMKGLNVPMNVEIERKAAAYKGGGTTAIWFRWGNVYAPAGYNWIGSEDKFPSDAEYMFAVEGGTPMALADVVSATLAATTGTWIRKTASALTLGILPIFHS